MSALIPDRFNPEEERRYSLNGRLGGTKTQFFKPNSYWTTLSATQAITSIHRPSVLNNISLYYRKKCSAVRCTVHPQRSRCCTGCKDLISVICCVTHRIIWCHACLLQSGQCRYVSYRKHLLQLRNTQFSSLAWPTNTNNSCSF